MDHDSDSGGWDGGISIETVDSAVVAAFQRVLKVIMEKLINITKHFDLTLNTLETKVTIIIRIEDVPTLTALHVSK